MVHSEQGYDVLKDRGRLIVEPALKPFKPMRIPEEGTYVLDGNNTFRVHKCAVYVSKEPHIATLDAAKIHFPLTVRRVEEGDWMQPFGMKGRKLLSDLMTDLKTTVFEKRRQLVVVDSQGVIVWAIGLRIADFVAVSDVTKTVIELVFSVQ
jgi:tRNA(Ile)-lysidine synthase